MPRTQVITDRRNADHDILIEVATLQKSMNEDVKSLLLQMPLKADKAELIEIKQMISARATSDDVSTLREADTLLDGRLKVVENRIAFYAGALALLQVVIAVALALYK